MSEENILPENSRIEGIFSKRACITIPANAVVTVITGEGARLQDGTILPWVLWDEAKP